MPTSSIPERSGGVDADDAAGHSGRAADPAGSGPGPGFRDPSLPFGTRADDLLGRLTEPEKISFLHQHSPAVPRLGLAEFHTGQEALHGAAWRGRATVFPQAVGLGAMWDPELAEAVGAATAAEVRALHEADPAVSLNVWAPVVNLLRDPRWGRNEEGYSEDPFLTARTAIAFCRGLCARVPDHRVTEHGDPGYLRTAPTLKHFLAYNNETDRATTSSVLRPRVLHEYDLPVFREPLEAGVACGIMPAYNLVNGRPCHVGPYLALARSWTAEDLLISSDAFAPSNLVDVEHYFDDHPSSHAAALRAGLDSFTDAGGDGRFTVARIGEALARGLITMKDVDRAVRRKLLVRLRLGEFDPDGGPHGRDGTGLLACPAHARLAADAARRAVVLLKNDGLLPLAVPPGGQVAVIGPLADTLHEDWYSGTMPYRVTVADGLREALAAADVRVTVTEAADRVTVGEAGPDGSGPGGRGPGRPAPGEFDLFDWGDDVVTLRSVANGRYLTVKDDGSLAADQDRPNGWVVHEIFRRDPATGALTPAAPEVRTAGRPRAGPVRDGVADAIAAARAADVAVVVVGNDPHINGRETQDRTTLALPPAQERLIQAVRSVNPRTVLVVMSSYPYAVTWADRHVPAIVWTCHGGQETGHAVADVLLGRAAPSGRLAQTWYRSDRDLPDLLDYDVIASRRTYQYFEGEPLYPFGHGLGYTTFRYTGLRLDGAPAAQARAGDTVTVTVDVTNTGTRGGSEVVQVYTRALPAHRGGRKGRWDRDRPRRRLCGFARVRLAPGESRTARIPLPVSALACWDVEAHEMTAVPGRYQVMAGASSADIRLTAVLTVAGPEPAPRRLTGRVVAAADFDGYAGVTLVDASREEGDAVAPAGGGPAPGDGPAWIVFRDALAGPAGQVTARVARAEPGEARLELRWAGPGSEGPHQGVPAGQVTVVSTGSGYAWTEVTAPAELGPGLGYLYLVLRGPQRLASFSLR